MKEERGFCPNCEMEGSVGSGCNERGCRRRGYCFIPSTFFEKVRAAPQDCDPEIGRRIGDYLVVDLMGCGGFGKIFLVIQMPIMARAVLRLMERSVTDPAAFKGAVTRFEQEVPQIAATSHPNLVRMLMYGVHRELPYLVTEHLEGRTLKQEFIDATSRGDGIPPLAIHHILRQSVSALEAAHSRNILHLDVSPTNVLLQRMSGDPYFVRMAALGLARFVEERRDPNMMAGNPQYMAPEQFEHGQLGSWTDLYSLGAVAFELLTRRRPFPGRNVQEVLARKLDPQFDPLTVVDDLSLPARTAQFLSQAIARRPESRFQTAAAFREAADTVLARPEPAPVPVEQQERAAAEIARIQEEKDRIEQERLKIEGERKKIEEEKRLIDEARRKAEQERARPAAPAAPAIPRPGLKAAGPEPVTRRAEAAPPRVEPVPRTGGPIPPRAEPVPQAPAVPPPVKTETPAPAGAPARGAPPAPTPATVEPVAVKPEVPPARTETSRAKIETPPAKVETPPVRVEPTIPRVEPTLAKSGASPARPETPPAKVEAPAVKVETPAKAEVPTVKVETQTPARIETTQVKFEAVTGKVETPPAKANGDLPSTEKIDMDWFLDDADAISKRDMAPPPRRGLFVIGGAVVMGAAVVALLYNVFSGRDTPPERPAAPAVFMGPDAAGPSVARADAIQPAAKPDPGRLPARAPENAPVVAPPTPPALASAIEPPKPPEKEEPPRPEKKVEPPGPEKKVEPPAKKAEPPKPEKKVAPAKPEKKKEPPKPAKSPKKEVKAAAKKTAPEPVELKEDKVKRFLKAGQAAYQKGDYKGAMASYARAQALDPKNQLARMLMERAKAKIK